jgi:isoleucyl-tRNA synthetase
MMDTSDAKKSEVAKREEATLTFWNDKNIFDKSVGKDAPNGDFVFYDGPPFATGLPHYGHLLQSAIKDAIPRYKTMRGYRVARQWGWDCHGLPIENIVEKQLGTKSKKEILEMGVKKFNDLCRERIFTFIGEWERIIPRFGRWADMAHAYRTMDFSYMQSEWWAFKTLHEKGLVYEDYRSMHICPRCETTLSQGEVAEGYKDVKDLSVTVKFKVKDPEKHNLPPNTYLLAWTTTPWTLPGNVALAVGPEVSYVQLQQNGETYLLAKERLSALGGIAIPEEKEFFGADLVGIEYEPLFDYYANDDKLKKRENGWKVYAADFVTADAGTGIAHEAPTFGADDWALLKQVGLPFVQHVNPDGTFKSEVIDFPALDLKPRAKGKPEEIREADLTVVKFLEKAGKVFSYAKYEHAYPHCWRCDTALLNYATSSWFVAVEKMKPTLFETAKGINWSPAHIKEGRFGQWLEGARDWSISRQRFWANTIPVWKCEQCKQEKVFGSAAELEAMSGIHITDLHKEVVDEITFPCSDCKGAMGAMGTIAPLPVMRRVSDVLDTWFDSGSVPFATKGYGASNVAAGENIVPADFIGEAQDQTRAWFYYQHVLAGGLFASAAFKNCVVTGIVLAEDGKKMSKKLNNYPDPQMMIDKYGADAMRLYMLSSPVVRAESLSFSEKEIAELSRKVFGRLENVLTFFALYHNQKIQSDALYFVLDVPRDFKSTYVLDRWIISRLGQLIKEATDGYERYALDEAVRPLGVFIDDLSTWYLRRSRDRFKGDDADDKKHALATLRYVLHTLARTMAPVAPFMAEHIFQAVREDEDEESVHLALWPDASQAHFDPNLLTVMEQARHVVSFALEARDKAGIKVRQPLASLTIENAAEFSAEVLAIIADEVNVKDVITGTTGLDLALTPDLREEGLMREFMRYVQGRRKEMNLVPSDTIRIFVPESDVVRRHETALRKTLNASEIIYAQEWQGTQLVLENDNILVWIERI